MDVQTWYLAAPGRLASVAGPATILRHVPDPTASTGPTNRWLAVDLGRGAAYPDRRHADEALLTFTSDPLPADLHVAGFPVVSLRLATSGSDGAIYVYLEDVAPDGEVVYRDRRLPAIPPSRDDRTGRACTARRAPELRPGRPLGGRARAGPRPRRGAAAGGSTDPGGRQDPGRAGRHDAACFDRYGPPDETFTVHLGGHSTLDLPILTSGSVSGSTPRT